MNIKQLYKTLPTDLKRIVFDFTYLSPELELELVEDTTIDESLDDELLDWYSIYLMNNVLYKKNLKLSNKLNELKREFKHEKHEKQIEKIFEYYKKETKNYYDISRFYYKIFDYRPL